MDNTVLSTVLMIIDPKTGNVDMASTPLHSCWVLQSSSWNVLTWGLCRSRRQVVARLGTPRMRAEMVSVLKRGKVTYAGSGRSRRVEVLSVPPLFLLDSGHSCGFRWNSGGIYQPKFHSCHEIVQFRYLHRNGPRSPGTGMAPESSDQN